MIKILKYGEVANSDIFSRVTPKMNVCEIVSEIIDNVRKNGDKALYEYTQKFDGANLSSLIVTDDEIKEALSLVDERFLEVLKKAARNIRKFHEKQVRQSFIINDEKGIGSWSLGTGFDSRVFGWLDNLESDGLTFQLFLKGELPKNEALLDKYVRLYDRGFIANRNGKDVVNVIVEKTPVFDEQFIANKVFVTRKLPDAVAAKVEKLVQKKILLEKPYYPGHMHKMLDFWHRVRPFNPNLVFEKLVKQGVLQPLTEEQKKGVMIIAYSDILPTQGM